MIDIDRNASTPVHDQLVERLRYLIASGRIKVGEDLPSTRALGKQLGLSFHTVRKAYQALEQEGLLDAQVGRGYRVVEAAPVSKGERLERGAAIAQEAVQRLVGLGMKPGEIAHVLEEQFEGLREAARDQKLLFVAASGEVAEICAAQLADALRRPVLGVTPGDLERHPDAEYAFAAFPEVRRVMDALPRADVYGANIVLPPAVLHLAVRMLSTQTIGLLCRQGDAVGPLSMALRRATGYDGQIVGASVESGSGQMQIVLDSADLLLHTPGARRRVQASAARTKRVAEIRPLIDDASLQAVRERIPV